MGLEGPPGLAAILSGGKFLHMLPCTSVGKHRMEDGPHLHVVPLEVHGKGAIGLELILFSFAPSARLENGCARYHLLIIGGIFGVLFTTRRVIIPIRGFKFV